MPAAKRKPLVVVRHTGADLIYDLKDVEALAQFMDSPTGRKIRVALDDQVIQLVLEGHSRDFALGAKYMMHFFYSLAETSKQSTSDDDEQMGVIQENTFAHPGAITGE